MLTPKYLSIDIGGTAIKFGLFNQAGQLIHHNRVPTPDDLPTFLNLIDQIVATHYQQITGIGISAPGKINPLTGTIYYGGALTYLDQLDLLDHLTNQFDNELLLALENDGKCAALAETWLGNLRGVQNGAAIVLGTGVGSGLILNGQLFRGSHFQAGELSFMSSGKKRTPTYGEWGSATLMIKRIAKQYRQPNLTGPAAFELINRHHPSAYQIFRNYCRRIAKQILAIQATVDLERYVIGGGISAQPIVADTIRAEYHKLIDQLDLTASMTPPAIIKANFENDANLYGALYNLLLKTNHELEVTLS